MYSKRTYYRTAIPEWWHHCKLRARWVQNTAYQHTTDVHKVGRSKLICAQLFLWSTIPVNAGPICCLSMLQIDCTHWRQKQIFVTIRQLLACHHSSSAQLSQRRISRDELGVSLLRKQADLIYAPQHAMFSSFAPTLLAFPNELPRWAFTHQKPNDKLYRQHI